MTCYYPQKAYRPLSTADGGRLVFNSKLALNPSNQIIIPCGNCIGCRLDRTGDWAMRCIHESQMHPQNCFITLTYDDEHLPEDYSVHVRVFQLFMKKLRNRYANKIRFYACGEYGPENLRPHYHSILFNHDFNDKIFHSKTSRGDILYTSKSLDQIWGEGFATIGDVTYQSAGYVAQYVMKKINGDRASTHYLRTHPVSNLVVQVQPEFSLQSTRPGIGSTWFDRFHTDAFPSDFLVVDGKPHRVPTYYLRKLQQKETSTDKFKISQHTESELIKRKRKRNALPRRADQTKERLAVREEVKLSRISTLKRRL